MSPPTALDRLPEDALRNITYFIGLCNMSDVCSSRLTCKTLAELLAPSSFGHVVLRTEQRAQALLDLCLSNTSLLCGTQKLTVGNPDQDGPAPRAALWEWLATPGGTQLLDKLSRVREVCVCQFSPRYPYRRMQAYPHKSTIAVVLRIGAFSHVRHLVVRRSELISVDVKLLYACPMFKLLDTLEVDNCGLDMLTSRRALAELDLVSPAEIDRLPLSQLSALIITGSGDMQIIVRTLMASCRLASLHKLRIMWGARSGQESLHALLAHVARSLRHLTVDIRCGIWIYPGISRSSLVHLETLELIEEYDIASDTHRPDWHVIYSALMALLPQDRQLTLIKLQIQVHEAALSVEDVGYFLGSLAFLDQLAMRAHEIDLVLVLGPNIHSPITVETGHEWVDKLLTTGAASGAIRRCTINVPAINAEISWTPDAYRRSE